MERLPPGDGGGGVAGTGGEGGGEDPFEILTVDGESPSSSPAPTLTIGQVLDLLPKLKQGIIFGSNFLHLVLLISSDHTKYQ